MATSSVNKGTTITAALKKQASVLNKEVLQATNELVDNSVKTVEKWQDLTEKVLKTGTKMLATQQDVALTTLEAIIGHYSVTRKRFNKLVSNKSKKVQKKADTEIDSDLTIDEVMEATTAKVKKATAPKKKLEAQTA